ncbi:MAG TPA: class I adenylate-forming enzyme family protein [Trebonia sp.]|jgi:2-furoate---CoA ligase|nr:class I adenylate-forming enzyme family protein [Trebonia sp.]
MDLGSALRRSAERFPARRAVGGPRPRTYAEWDARTDRLARGLAASGVAPGQRVLFALGGGEPLASLHLAAQKLGAVSVPLSVRLSAAEAAYCLDDCAPALVVTDDSTEGKLAEALRAADACPPVTVEAELAAAGGRGEGRAGPPPGEDAISVLLYTSGTTGRPKGVPRSHRAEYFAALAHLIQARQPIGAVSLGVMPMFHTMGLRALLASVLCSGTWVPQASFDAGQSADLIRDEGIDTLYLVPTAYWALVRTGRLADLRSVRRIAYAGAPMSPSLAGELAAAFQPEAMVNHFGSTEVYTFSVSADTARKPGCAGRAGVFGRLRLVSPERGAPPDAIVGDGEQGQVIVAMDSPEAFAGYWHRPDADARAIRDGWYYTGDLGHLDDEGDLWVSGRVDDMINSGGENIYPDDIERTLAGAPCVDQVVVAGTPHEKWGQAVTAFFVPAGGTCDERTIARFDEWVRTESGLPSMKRPKRYVAVRSIPTSAVGKILRRQLTTDGAEVLADSADSAAGGGADRGADRGAAAFRAGGQP